MINSYCHFASIEGQHLSGLLEARADLNERYSPSLTNPIGFAYWIKGKFYRPGGPSILARMGYHHRGATPLMAAIICGNFDVAARLISEGADLDLKNSKGKTALDFALEGGFAWYRNFVDRPSFAFPGFGSQQFGSNSKKCLAQST